MSLTPEDVKKVAHLSRLEITDEQLAPLTKDLSNILDLVDQLNQADTSDISPLAHSHDLTQRLREDKVTETDQREALMQNAPLKEADLFLVPQVIE